MNSYELRRLKTRYNNMRENVSRAISILSNVNFNDKLSSSTRLLTENLAVNNASMCVDEISDVKTRISSDVSKLRDIIYSIDLKINELNKKITDAELAENML